MRTNLALTITCMVNSTAVAIQEDAAQHIDETIIPLNESDPLPTGGAGQKVIIDYGGSLVWGQHVQNLLFSGTFWGALLTVLPSMYFIQRHSARVCLFLSVLCYAVSSASVPLLSTHTDYHWVFASRVFMGLGEGFVMPAINAIISSWYPVMERSTALALFTMGNQIAGAGGNPLAAGICHSQWGWPAVFYLGAFLASVWCVLWICVSSDQPADCKVMTHAERSYLSKMTVNRTAAAKRSDTIPYRAIFTSVPFIAQLLSNFLVNMMVTFLQIYLPSYYKDVLLLGVIANGVYSSIPNVFNVCFKLFWGVLMDKLKEKNIASPTFCVRLSQGIASFIPALCMLGIGLLVDSTRPQLALVFMCILTGSMGALTSGFYTSLLSLAPRYTAALSSISMFFTMTGRLVTPAVVGTLKKTGSVSEWRLLFISGAAASTISGIIFCSLGSGDVQPWGREDEAKEELEVEEKEVEKLIMRAKADSICIS